MLKRQLLIATSILLLNFNNVSSAATVEELERQLQQMQQQTELLQKQLLELKSAEQTNQQPQQLTPVQTNEVTTAVTPTEQQPAPNQPLEATTQTSTNQPQQPSASTPTETVTDGVKVDANGNLYGEGMGTAAVSSLNVVIKNNPNIPATTASTQTSSTTNTVTPTETTQTPTQQTQTPTTTIEQAITPESTTQQAQTEAPANTELQNAIAKVQTGDFAAAQSELTAYVADETKPDLNVAYYWLGESLFRQSQYEPAAMAFTKSYKQDNKSEIAPDALIRLSLALGLLNRTEEACKLLQHAINSFPNETAKIAIAADERRRLNCQ